ncbi:MAG: hypothetical protein HUK15_06290 [Bacteroidales bacterium]|nr:hypothetical protein [Bacteroidales bacterium]
MKTIVCGPPHSGKSVFISNLVKQLPSGHYIRINANGDGEGTWSNNPNQDDVMKVRVKGTNDAEDFKRWRSQIESAKKDIVIVDIGGRLHDDKISLFEACDSFIVVSNCEKVMQEWIRFGTSHGCACIGTILSKLEGNENIESKEPYIQGEMSGLERGRRIKNSELLNAIASAIIDRSGFKEHKKPERANVVDMYDIGVKLGMYEHTTTEKGKDIFNVWYQPEKAPLLYNYLKENYVKMPKYRIYGARSIWASCLVASCLAEIGVRKLDVFAHKSERYISAHKIPIGNNENNPLKISIVENEECVLLKVALPTRFTPEISQKATLPPLNPNKKFLLSGKMPSWFAVGIILSYSNREKYIHLPGIGYIKIEDSDANNLGEIMPFEDLN